MIAEQEAKSLGHDWIGSEHILLAVTKVVNTVAARALASLGIDYVKAKAEVVKMVEPRDGEAKGMTLSPRVQKIVGYATGFGDASGQGFSPETLLLALSSERDGIAGQILTTFGATPQRIHEALNNCR